MPTRPCRTPLHPRPAPPPEARPSDRICSLVEQRHGKSCTPKPFCSLDMVTSDKSRAGATVPEPARRARRDLGPHPPRRRPDHRGPSGQRPARAAVFAAKRPRRQRIFSFKVLGSQSEIPGQKAGHSQAALACYDVPRWLEVVSSSDCPVPYRRASLSSALPLERGDRNRRAPAATCCKRRTQQPAACHAQQQLDPMMCNLVTGLLFRRHVSVSSALGIWVMRACQPPRGTSHPACCNRTVSP